MLAFKTNGRSGIRQGDDDFFRPSSLSRTSSAMTGFPGLGPARLAVAHQAVGRCIRIWAASAVVLASDGAVEGNAGFVVAAEPYQEAVPRTPK